MDHFKGRRPTTNGVLWRRNAANDGWKLLASLATSMVQAKTTNYTALISDFARTITLSGTFTLSLTAAATLTDGWWCDVINIGSGNVTVDPNSTELIDGQTTITVGPGASARISCTGTAFRTFAGSGVPTLHRQVFTSSSTFTTPANTSTNTLFRFTLTAGGGGGGSNTGMSGNGGRGGNGGALLVSKSGVAPGTGITVTIGAGGSAGANGSSSSIASPVSASATGGAKGDNAPGTGADGADGANGTSSGGDVDLSGAPGLGPYGYGGRGQDVSGTPVAASGGGGLCIVEWIAP